MNNIGYYMVVMATIICAIGCLGALKIGEFGVAVIVLLGLAAGYAILIADRKANDGGGEQQ